MDIHSRSANVDSIVWSIGRIPQTPVTSDDADEFRVEHFRCGGAFAEVDGGEGGDLWDVVDTSDFAARALKMERVFNINRYGNANGGGTYD